MTEQPQPLHVSFNDGVACVALNRSAHHNTLDDTLVEILGEQLDRLAENPTVEALLLVAEGRHFSAGGDIAFLAEVHARLAAAVVAGEGQDALASFAANMRGNARLTQRILALPFPTVAAVQGACVGAALALIAACDARVAHVGARPLTGYAALGLGTDFGVGVLLSELVGAGTAQRWLLGEAPISAEEAFDAGFFTDLVGDDVEGLRTAAEKRARTLAALGPAALAVRASTRPRTCGEGFGAELDAEAERFARSLASPRAGERIAAALRERGS